MPRHRTQLDLEPEPHKALGRQERQAVDRGLTRRRAERACRLAALDELASLSAEIGPIAGDPVAEVRKERDREMEAVLRGQTTV